MKKFLFLFVIASQCALNANMGPEGFGQYHNKYFVETGTMSGESVIKALKSGFEEVRSIESYTPDFQSCEAHFKKDNRVKIYYGDSSKDLWGMIADINAPITFWLDAHICPPRADGGKNCPLIEELEQIAQHPIKSHTILIDDMHCCDKAEFDFLSKEDIKRKVLEINPDYTISYVPGGDDGEYPHNVMVAQLLSKK